VLIIEAMTKFLDSVCARSFTDIVKEEVQYIKLVREHKLEYENIYGVNPYVRQGVYHNTHVPGASIVSHSFPI